MSIIDPAIAVQRLPRHVAIVMDGNGRWAEARHRPRTFGHHEGAKAVRATVEACVRRHIPVLTLFAFSSENWQRPEEEVSTLMKLFLRMLDSEIEELHRRGVRGYVTVNTLIFGNELAEMEQYLRAIIAAGVDAAIVQDVGVCRLIRQLSPDFPIHASTQMTVTSAGGVEFARELGCNLVVLARVEIRQRAAMVAANFPKFRSSSFPRRPKTWSGRCGKPSSAWRRLSRPSSPSPMVPAAPPASARTRPSSAS